MLNSIVFIDKGDLKYMTKRNLKKSILNFKDEENELWSDLINHTPYSNKYVLIFYYMILALLGNRETSVNKQAWSLSL